MSIAELHPLCRNLITKQPGAIVDSVESVSPNDALASFQRSNGGIKTHLLGKVKVTGLEKGLHRYLFYFTEGTIEAFPRFT